MHLALLAASETVNPVLPDVTELIYGTLSFAILFFFLFKKVFPSIRQAFDERTRRIQSALEEAEDNRQEAQAILDDYREQLSDAREESRRIVEEAKEAAERARREIITRAEQEAHGILERAEREIEAQRNHAFAQLRQEVGELAVAVAGRIVHEQLDGERHLRLVDDYIDELTSADGARSGGSGAAG